VNISLNYEPARLSVVGKIWTIWETDIIEILKQDPWTKNLQIPCG
jgi:hypothetical protein